MQLKTFCFSLMVVSLFTIDVSYGLDLPSESTTTPATVSLTNAGATKAAAPEVLLNNAGTKALFLGQYDEAIKDYEAAVKLNPKYGLAKQNLAKAYNNSALRLSNDQEKALPLFRKAFWLDNTNRTTAENISAVIKSMGLDPDSAAVRTALAHKAVAINDFVGFNIETAAAKWLTEHPGQTWISSVSSTPQTYTDFGPYLAEMNRTIRQNWYPPKQHESKRVLARFKIHKNGQMTDLQLFQSSGVAVADQAALDAVQKSNPFAQLPQGAADPIEVQFNFDYNVFAAADKKDK